MVFSTRVKLEDYRPTRNHDDTPGIPKYIQEVPWKARAIFSWRSKRSASDLSDRDIEGNFGIRNPITRGPLLSVLADRKRWAMQLNSLSTSRPGTSLSQARLKTKTDMGHDHWVCDYEVLSAGYVEYIRKSNGWRTAGSYYSGLGTIVPRGFPATPATFPVVLPNTRNDGWTARVGSSNFAVTAGVPIHMPPSTLSRQNRLNRAFDSMNPEGPAAKLGETIVSLIRGDVPRLLRNISDGITAMQRAFTGSPESLLGVPRALGSEYLNSTFGWQPLIDDILSAIKVLTTVDRLVYGSSSRRSRFIPWDTRFDERRRTGAESHNLYSDRSLAWGYVSLQGVPANALPFETQITSSFDIALSARLTGIARPGLGANDFISQAEDKIHALGLWYPALGWDLLPYSFLVDWFSHLGSAIGNASYYGRLGVKPLDYAWATTQYKVVSETGTKIDAWETSAFKGRSLGHAHTVTRARYREQATPFGFGLDIDQLNSSQAAILVALGLARIPG